MVLHLLALCWWYGLAILNTVWTIAVIRELWPVDDEDGCVIVGYLGLAMFCSCLAATRGIDGVIAALIGIFLHAHISIPAWFTAKVRRARLNDSG